MIRFVSLLVTLALSVHSWSQSSIYYLRCKTDTTQHYALHLPASYTDTTYCPLVIFLDPAARGDLPIRQYQKLADELGIVLAGAFNSSNFNIQSSLSAFTAIYNDVVSAYRIRSGAVWVSGFSGGARAAALIAMSYEEVSGVIACGAGFADEKLVNAGAIKNYCGIIGLQDMNYTELLENSNMLDESNISNLLLTFKGGHDWPPPGIMGLAFEWMFEQSAISLKDRYPVPPLGNKEIVADSTLYQTWLQMEQLSRIARYNDSALLRKKVLENANGFKADKNNFEGAIVDETNYLNRFSLLLNRVQSTGEKVDFSNWESLAKELSRLYTSTDTYRRLSAIRCTDHTYRSVLENYYRLMNSQQYDYAIAVAEVLLPFKPVQINPWFLMARAAAMNGKKKAAASYLRKGNNDDDQYKQQVKADKALLTIFSLKELEQLVQEN